MVAFMMYGFIPIYLRDFALGKEAWIESYNTDAHFEARLALAGLHMPLGILGEMYLGLPYYFVLVGGLLTFLGTSYVSA
jgi:hypothetical protein